MNTPLVYILILNYNSWKDTIECIESLLKQTYSHFQIIVVDNASPDQSMKYIENWATSNVTYTYLTDNDFYLSKLSDIQSKLLLVQSSDNGGFAAGNNIFLKKARSEEAYIWLLNPDMTLEKNTLEYLVNFAESIEKQQVIGCILKEYDHPEKIFLVGGARINKVLGTVSFVTEAEEISQLDYIHGGALFTHLSNFDLVGILPLEYFLYWEEADWCFQAKAQGLGFQVCLNAVAYDKIGGSVGRGYLAEYYYTRNALKFAFKYYKTNIPFILWFNSLRFAKRVIQGNFSRARAIVKGSIDFLLSK